MVNRSSRTNARLMCGAAALALTLWAGAAQAADSAKVDIAPQPLASALNEFGVQTGRQVIYAPSLAGAKTTRGVSASGDIEMALAQLLEGSGLTFRRSDDTFLIVQAGEGGSGPQDESAADVDALIVTAQKREEAIQDVPIAISAFSQKALEEQKIEGGYDLLKAIPNVTFSKSNFSSYNFSIRGVGTKAISATTDPGVAVAFNNTTLIQNRLFEQEYFDVERVEVLRGPQGTLYGRNATSGVINVITAKPKLGDFEGSIKAEVGNYDSQRLVGMVNIPIIEDVLAVRLAAAGTQRSGYDYNETTGNAVNGRSLWSGRLTVGFEPMPSLRANLVWEHFEEDDNRSRTSKQLCHTDPGPSVVGSTQVGDPNDTDPLRRAKRDALLPAVFSQACKPGSLYDEAAFGTPNGVALPFVFAPLYLGVPCSIGCLSFGSLGSDPATGNSVGLLRLEDPYGGLTQSKDLRTIASIRDPVYRAKADLFELSLDLDIGNSLTLTSQTAYNEDSVYSFQDYNRFNSFPVFSDTSNILAAGGGPSNYQRVAPGGEFCDPQIGCSKTLAGFDISQASGKQFSQELRLSSDFEGSINFNFGANYTRFKTLVDYYVFYNLLTALAVTAPLNSALDPTTMCGGGGGFYGIQPSLPPSNPLSRCPYVDPNPIDTSRNFDGDGHNYFRSKNPYELESSAAFGEVYWNATEDLKLTAGLRYTDDTKTFIPVPSQVLLAMGNIGGGTTSIGYPERAPIEQNWGEWTGRIGLDWKPQLPFTNATMLYGFYSRGYKGGGANPPQPGFATVEEVAAQQAAEGFPVTNQAVLFLTAVEYSDTFEPEFVDALEVGAKNTLLGGAMTLNLGTFYYDYKDYQVSQIRDRTAVNENFDATIWGLEFETVFSPTRDFRINANLGYLDTKIADGETSIDIMNRTQGNPNYVLAKPWVQLPSNCVIPISVAERFVQDANASPSGGLEQPYRLCGGIGASLIAAGAPSLPWDPNPAFGGGLLRYDYRNYPELNGGAGLKAQLGGNELPNAPHWTTNIGGQFGRDIFDGSWRLTLRGDAYWQSQSWARVYNAVNDKLHGWYNLNFSVRMENRDLGLEAEFYVKNLLDKSPITDAFLNSDDSGLTTNVFVLDPRLVGFNVRKTF